MRFGSKLLLSFACLISYINADAKGTQFSITFLQSGAPISLDGRSNLLHVKQYRTENSDDAHNVQHARVLENKTAVFSSAGANFILKPSKANQKQVQLEIVREFNDDVTQQALTTTIRVPIGRWIEVSGEHSALKQGKPMRSFATEKAPDVHSHLYVKVERIQ